MLFGIEGKSRDGSGLYDIKLPLSLKTLSTDKITAWLKSPRVDEHMKSSNLCAADSSNKFICMTVQDEEKKDSSLTVWVLTKDLEAKIGKLPEEDSAKILAIQAVVNRSLSILPSMEPLDRQVLQVRNEFDATLKVMGDLELKFLEQKSGAEFAKISPLKDKLIGEFTKLLNEYQHCNRAIRVGHAAEQEAHQKAFTDLLSAFTVMRKQVVTECRLMLVQTVFAKHEAQFSEIVQLVDEAKLAFSGESREKSMLIRLRHEFTEIYNFLNMSHHQLLEDIQKRKESGIQGIFDDGVKVFVVKKNEALAILAAIFDKKPS